MKANEIIHADVLDIVFENKNKEYGAYELRKNYNKRISKSLAIMMSSLVVLFISQSFKTPKAINTVHVSGVIDLTDLSSYKKEVNKPIDEPQKHTQSKQVASVKHLVPTIVSNIDTNEVPPIDILDTSLISNHTNLNATASNNTVQDANNNSIGGEGGEANYNNVILPVEPTVKEDEPLWAASQMPEFIGGATALSRFLERQLPQPDDLNEGEKITVIAKFIVDKNGKVKDIEIIKNGRQDLDNAVIKVLEKMPNWKPALQNGTPVAVYFKLPVSFVANY